MYIALYSCVLMPSALNMTQIIGEVVIYLIYEGSEPKKIPHVHLINTEIVDFYSPCVLWRMKVTTESSYLPMILDYCNEFGIFVESYYVKNRNSPYYPAIISTAAIA